MSWSNHSAAVHWEPDPEYETQVNYNRHTPCLLECRPPRGPDQIIPPGGNFVSFRAFEMPLDSTDRERRGLAVRRMYRTLAPWVTENPVLMHVRTRRPGAVRLAVDQCADVGFETGDHDLRQRVQFREPRRRLPTAVSRSWPTTPVPRASRWAATRCWPAAARARRPTTRRARRRGSASCRAWAPDGASSTWPSSEALHRVRRSGRAGARRFLSRRHVRGHDASRPPRPGRFAVGQLEGHHGAFTNGAAAQGVYLNIPDWYFLNGGSKTGMGYRETNWSLPREYQEIIERQNIFDGTWEKTPSMGWMFVPLTQYHGGGAGRHHRAARGPPAALRATPGQPLRRGCAGLLPRPPSLRRRRKPAPW